MKLHARYGEQVQFLDVFVRQNHPGEVRGTYADYGEKLAGPASTSVWRPLPWPIVVDDYAGSVHREWGFEMADPTLLVDAGGRVAFAATWTHVPTLKRAIDALLAQSGRGVVLGGLDRRPGRARRRLPRPAPWRDPRRRRARPQRAGSGMLCRLGNLAKPLLAPIALTAAPWGQEHIGSPH
jgi:hypothetical protein